jgi:hypothetical protein
MVRQPINKHKAPFQKIDALQERCTEKELPFFPLIDFKAFLSKAKKHSA